MYIFFTSKYRMEEYINLFGDSPLDTSDTLTYEDMVNMRNRFPISYERLLLSMYIGLYPVNNDYYNIKIGYDDIGNYIDLDKRQIVLRTYRNSNHYGNIYNDIDDGLYEEIITNLKKYPREYLFVQIRKKSPYPIPSLYNKWANVVLKRMFGGTMTLTKLRHLCINNDKKWKREIDIPQNTPTTTNDDFDYENIINDID